MEMVTIAESFGTHTMPFILVTATSMIMIIVSTLGILSIQLLCFWILFVFICFLISIKWSTDGFHADDLQYYIAIICLAISHVYTSMDNILVCHPGSIITFLTRVFNNQDYFLKVGVIDFAGNMHKFTLAPNASLSDLNNLVFF